MSRVSAVVIQAAGSVRGQVTLREGGFIFLDTPADVGGLDHVAAPFLKLCWGRPTAIPHMSASVWGPCPNPELLLPAWKGQLSFIPKAV